VPDIPSFAVDDGFTYGVPDGVDVHVGSRVRIRVSGRRLRGFVTSLVPIPDRRIIDLDGVVGDIPSFDEVLLGTSRWAARHYVAPLSTILTRTVPTNVPRSDAGVAKQSSARSSVNARHRVHAEIAALPYAPVIEKVLGASDAAAMIVVPSVLEAEDIARDLGPTYGERVVVAHSDLSGRAETAAWVRAATSGDSILVGTREVALWPVAALGRIIVVEELRRVHKSPSTPTVDTATVARRRARDAGIPITFVGPVPSVSTTVAADDTVRRPGRIWPVIEVVDRREEPPTGSVILERTRAAIVGAARHGKRVFVLVPRRGYARATRCARCGTLRRCPACQAASSTDDRCDRCGTALGPCAECGSTRWQALGAGIGNVIAEIKRSTDDVGDAASGSTVQVGTERDLVGLTGIGLAVAVDVDGMAGAPNYRAHESALFVLARLALTVVRGTGNRCLIQTSDPTQPVVEALRAGDSLQFTQDEIQTRKDLGFPPFGELIAIEVATGSQAPELLDEALRDRARLLGPADMGDRLRWLVQGPDLGDARLALRGVVGHLRDTGVRVRVDADPIDL